MNGICYYELEVMFQEMRNFSETLSFQAQVILPSPFSFTLGVVMSEMAPITNYS